MDRFSQGPETAWLTPPPTFGNPTQPVSGVNAWIQAGNDDPKPLVWTKTAAEISADGSVEKAADF